jgi:predicted kinase
MRHVRILLITGLPGTGKSTLARLAAGRFHIPLLAKDAVKEPLLNVLGAPDPVTSRQLSTASFAVLFSMARELMAAGVSFVLEGNFRPGEHEAPLWALLHQSGPDCTLHLAQVLCRVNEAERVRRLHVRSVDPTRHPGHQIGERATLGKAPAGDAFLDIPGDRFVAEGDAVLQTLDHWWRTR